LDWDFYIFNINLKGTGTQKKFDLAKVVSLDRYWLVGLTDNLYKFLKCCFIFLIIFSKKNLVVLAKIMSIANVNKIVFL